MIYVPLVAKDTGDHQFSFGHIRHKKHMRLPAPSVPLCLCGETSPISADQRLPAIARRATAGASLWPKPDPGFFFGRDKAQKARTTASGRRTPPASQPPGQRALKKRSVFSISGIWIGDEYRNGPRRPEGSALRSSASCCRCPDDKVAPTRTNASA